MRKEVEEEKAGGADATKTWDCLVIGGGPAGLSAAIYLARMRRSVLVIDDEEGRSTWHQVNRNYLGFPDGVHATALRDLGRKQAARYGAEFLSARAGELAYEDVPAGRRFKAETTKGPVVGRTLIIASGVSDSFPEFDGSVECIGKSMFWCIICDGYEAIDKKLVVLGHNNRAASLALELVTFTKDVTLVSWDKPFDITPEKRSALREHNIELYESGCNIYQCGQGQLSSITLDGGKEIPLDMLFVAQWIEPKTQIANQLNLKVDEHGYIMVDVEQKTSLDGVYAAGDVTRLNNHQVTSAVHEGGSAAASANYYLYDDWQKE